MKLRILGNSLRIRVTRTELQGMVDHGEAQARVEFGAGAALHYVLRTDENAQHMAATYADNVVSVRIPAAQAREWTTTDLVSLRGEQVLGDGATLEILVEKDFACLEPREGEDESDMFPHPEDAAKSC